MNLLHMPSTPPLADRRKRGRRQTADIIRPIASNSIPLLDDVRFKMAKMWRYGTQIAYIAKMYRLTIPQTECAIHEAIYGTPQPVEKALPTVSQSRGLHVVVRRAA